MSENNTDHRGYGFTTAALMFAIDGGRLTVAEAEEAQEWCKALMHRDAELKGASAAPPRSPSATLCEHCEVAPASCCGLDECTGESTMLCSECCRAGAGHQECRPAVPATQPPVQLSERMSFAIGRLAALLPNGEQLAMTNAAQMLNDAADMIQELRAVIRSLRGRDASHDEDWPLPVSWAWVERTDGWHAVGPFGEVAADGRSIGMLAASWVGDLVRARNEAAAQQKRGAAASNEHSDVVWRDGKARVGSLRVSLSRVTDNGWHAVFRHDDCVSDLAMLTCVDDDQGRVERLAINVAREMQR